MRRLSKTQRATLRRRARREVLAELDRLLAASHAAGSSPDQVSPKRQIKNE